MVTLLEGLVAKAKKDGWATGRGSIEDIQREAMLLRYTEVPVRRGSPAVATLRPVRASDAPPNSLSAKYGVGAQPLHTDGAHLTKPPDFLVLACEASSKTPTRLWQKPRIWRRTAAIENGVFLVSNSKESFFSSAYTHEYGFRYDPTCMVPCDARAKEAAAYFESLEESAVEHSWDVPGTLLVVNNRQALHARASAADEPEREIKRLALHARSEK